MWLVFRLASLFLYAGVSYFDEYLQTHESFAAAGKHQRVGSMLLISTVFGFVSLVALVWFVDLSSVGSTASLFAIGSAVPLVAMLAGYFYVLEKFAIQYVAPLFLFSTIWLLIFELASGDQLAPLAVLGIVVAFIGSYLLDVGEFAFKIPKGAALVMGPVTFVWSLYFLMVEAGTQSLDGLTVYFYSISGTTVIGFVLFALVKPYRQGFLNRLKGEKVFAQVGLVNEVLAQGSFMFQALAIAVVPFVSYVAAVEGLSSLFLLGFLVLFPINERSKVNRVQVFAILILFAATALLAVAS